MDPGRFAAVVLVEAPEPVRRQRLIEQRGLAPEQADQLLAAQMPSAGKRTRADLIIDNDGNREQLRDRAWLAWRKLVSKARARA
jgi:dephospho-CoA kinase